MNVSQIPVQFQQALSLSIYHARNFVPAHLGNLNVGSNDAVSEVKVSGLQHQ